MFVPFLRIVCTFVRCTLRFLILLPNRTANFHPTKTNNKIQPKIIEKQYTYWGEDVSAGDSTISVDSSLSFAEGRPLSLGSNIESGNRSNTTFDSKLSDIGFLKKTLRFIE